MKNISIWNNYLTDKSNNQEIANNINTDILIIGAGITGLTTAYFLKDTNYKITVIDKDKIGNGTTAKTTAKISYIEQDIYQKLTRMHGSRIAKKYYESKKDAITLLNKIINDNNIECDKQLVQSILFTNDKKNINKLITEKNILSSYKENPKKYQDNHIKYGFSVSNTYTFNPIKYLMSLKNIVKSKTTIYENTIAKSIKKDNNNYIVLTNNGLINTKKIVLACHYPFFIIPYFFPLRTYIEREYVSVAKINNPQNKTFINIDKSLYSVRYYKNYLIYGSFDHRLTSKIDYGKNLKKHQSDFIKYFNVKPEYTWINQDIVSNDKLPIIGKIKENIYISTAYNAWGMTSATIGAKIIADLIQNKDNKYITLFNPRRINIPLIINSIIGIFHYLKAYFESLFHKSNPHYVKIKGFLYGVYLDKNGIEHKVKLLCPHMKCSLVFNKEEKTWDCPCHGSRFDLDGNIICSPAVKKI